jgi:hypothetical protein
VRVRKALGRVLAFWRFGRKSVLVFEVDIPTGKSLRQSSTFTKRTQIQGRYYEVRQVKRCIPTAWPHIMASSTRAYPSIIHSLQP